MKKLILFLSIFLIVGCANNEQPVDESLSALTFLDEEDQSTLLEYKALRQEFMTEIHRIDLTNVTVDRTVLYDLYWRMADITMDELHEINKSESRDEFSETYYYYVSAKLYHSVSEIYQSLEQEMERDKVINGSDKSELKGLLNNLDELVSLTFRKPDDHNPEDFVKNDTYMGGRAEEIYNAIIEE